MPRRTPKTPSTAKSPPDGFRPYFVDDGVTLEFHCDRRTEVIVAVRLMRALTEEINRLRGLVDAAEVRRMDATVEQQD